LKFTYLLEIFNTEITEEYDRLDKLMGKMGETCALVSVHTAACRTDQVGILAHFVTVVYIARNSRPSGQSSALNTSSLP
jgi:hypothetical protein